MTDSWRVWRGGLPLLLFLTLTTFARYRWGTRRWTHASPVAQQAELVPAAVRGAIQGVKVAGRCAFPTYDVVYQKHSGLVATIGEEDTETCAGVMYFGDWVEQLARSERNAIERGARTDTTRLEPYNARRR